MTQAQQAKQPTEADLIEVEAYNQNTLAPWWRAGDMASHYPCSMETVVDLLTATEYDVNRDLILQYIGDKVIPSPERQHGHLTWTATDIVRLVVHLESRRRWKKRSRIHGHKLNQYEKLQELAELSGETSCFNDLDKWDIGGMLALLQEPGCEFGHRQAIAVGIKLKLKQLGIEV